jgi:hypothetical protein
VLRIGAIIRRPRVAPRRPRDRAATERDARDARARRGDRARSERARAWMCGASPKLRLRESAPGDARERETPEAHRWTRAPSGALLLVLGDCTSITINFLENITDEGDQQDTPRRDADISAAS